MALTQVTSAGLKDGEIVNADLHSAASVALSKLASTGALGSAVTATTQSASDDSTKLATTAFVQAAVTSLIDGAPGSLNTLNELAAAINDDSSYATTLTTALATKAPLASPTFTGTVTSSYLTLSAVNPNITFTDTNENPDFRITVNSGEFSIEDLTNSATRFKIKSDGSVNILETGDNKGLRIHTNGGISATNNELRFNTGQSNGFTFMTNSDGGSSNERLRITSGGHMSLGGGANPSSTNGGVGLKFGIKSGANNVLIGETTSSSHNGLLIESRLTGRSGGARTSQINIGQDGTGGHIIFSTAAGSADVTQRLKITRDGCVFASNFGIGTDSNWKIRANTSNTDLAFEYSTSSSLSDNNIKAYFQGSSTDSRLIFRKTETGSCGLEFRNVTTQKAYQMLDSEENMVYLAQSGVHHRFYVGGSNERFRISADGSIRVDGATAATHGLRFTPGGWNGYDNRMGYCGTSGADFWWSSNWNPTDGSRDHSGYTTNYIKQNIVAGYVSVGTGDTNTSPSERVRIAKDGNIGIGGINNPQTTLNVKGTISTGRNVAREVGTVISYSSQFNAARTASNVLNGKKNYENGNNDWLTSGNSQVNAWLIIDLGASYLIDRAVIYNQNEYSHSNREVKNFTLEGSSDNSSWTTVLDDDLGKSSGHEPNPGWSFRIPHGFEDDNEGNSYRYWRFTMKTFHGSDSYGGIMEIELYEASNVVTNEITTSSLVAGDVYSQTGSFTRLTGQLRKPESCAFNYIHSGGQSLNSGNTIDQWQSGDSRCFENKENGSYLSNGVFTAPVTGAYFFTSTLLLSGVSGTNGVHLYWQKNGSGAHTYWETRFNQNSTGYGGYEAVSGQCLMQLDAGETCRIKISYSGSNCSVYGTDGNWGNWGGFLVG